MNNYFGLKRLLLVFLATLSFVGVALAANDKPKSNPSYAIEKSAKDPNSKPGYSVDGRTSASVLAAKRSHQVAKKDEIGLSVFSGLFAIAVIGFFSKKLFDNQ